MEKVHSPKAPTWDDEHGAWVRFPDGKSYLLPIIARETRLVPSFEDDDVSMTVQAADEKLATLVDQFLVTLAHHGRNPTSGEIIPKVDGRSVVGFTPTTYAQFISLVRHLLLRNYAFGNEELQRILSLTRPQVGQLIDAVVRHLTTRE